MFTFKKAVKENSDIQELKEHYETIESRLAEIISISKKESTRMTREIEDLQKQKTIAEIELMKVKEEHEKEKRTITHMVGLERDRQEFEIDAAKREVTLTVREEQLKAERESFEKRIKEVTDRMQGEIGRMESLTTQVLERLPHVTVDRHIKEVKNDEPRAVTAS